MGARSRARCKPCKPNPSGQPPQRPPLHAGICTISAEPPACNRAVKNAVAALSIFAVCTVAQAAAAPATPPTGPGTAAALTALTRAREQARSRDPQAVQHRYEAARNVEDGLAAITPAASCRGLYDALSAVAHGSVLAAEGFDRLSNPVRRRGERRMSAGLAAYRRVRSTCPVGIRAADRPKIRPRTLLAPLAEEAFFGEVRLTVPPDTRQLELLWRGRSVLRQDDPRSGVQRLRLPGTSESGRGTLEAIFRAADGTIRARAESVWLLPANARRSTVHEREDAALAARLAVIASGFPGFAGIYVHDMATGGTASWNAEARFPAASTVKLGVLAAALDRHGPSPERSPYLYDMRVLAAWSSNLAANRLLRSLGSGDLSRGRRIVEARLRRLGATRSTYPGEYRVGTSHASSPLQPPLVSARTTSAEDLGRVLATLQGAAAGNTRAQHSSGLSQHEARVGIALLLDSEPSGENIGLFRPWLPKAMPAAQKHGWVSSARHSAAVIYGLRGPVVVSLVTYQAGLTLRDAQRLARKVVLAALS